MFANRLLIKASDTIERLNLRRRSGLSNGGFRLKSAKIEHILPFSQKHADPDKVFYQSQTQMFYFLFQRSVVSY